MDKLMVRMTLADILLVEALISRYMKDNKIKKIDDVDASVIQQQYDEIVKNEMWSNPAEFPSIKCPKCRMVSYNTNDIQQKFCGNCHEWHEDMKLKEQN